MVRMSKTHTLSLRPFTGLVVELNEMARAKERKAKKTWSGLVAYHALANKGYTWCFV